MSTLNQSKINEYFFANQKLTTLTLALTLIATQVGGGMILGVCETAYTAGIWGILYPCGQVIGFLITLAWFAKLFRKHNIATISEIFSLSFKSQPMRKLASALSCFSLFVILIGQGIAVKKLLIGFGLTQPVWVFVTWIVMLLYTSIGGFKTVVKTDTMQLLIVVLVMSLLAFFTINNYEFDTRLIVQENTFSGLAIFNMLLWPALYIVIGQDMVQRFNAAQSTVTLLKAIKICLLGIILVALIPVFIGIIAAGNPEIAISGSVLLSVARQFSSIMLVLGFIGILMAILSTADSLLCAISSMVAIDLFNTENKMNTKRNVSITLAVGSFAYLGTFLSDSILGTFVFSYGVTASTLFVPIVYGLLQKRISLMSAWFSIVVGFASYLILFMVNQDYCFLSLIAAWLSYETSYVLRRTTNESSFQLNTR